VEPFLHLYPVRYKSGLTRTVCIPCLQFGTTVVLLELIAKFALI
jgi:hypothetical protein